jgi:signal transduction histidine kinase
MIYNKKMIYSLLVFVFFLMCFNIFYYRYCIIHEILIKEYDIANYNLGKLCIDYEHDCKILMKEFRIDGMQYKNKDGVIIKEVGNTNIDKIRQINKYEFYLGGAIDPMDNMNYLSIIQSALLQPLDSYLINGYIYDGRAHRMVIPTHFSDYSVTSFVNVSKTWKHINNATKKIFLISLSILSFFTAVIFYNTYYVGYIVHNLHESKVKAETENSEKTEFLSNVSHELRTPLNSIIGFSEIIMYRSFGDLNPQHQNYIENIHSSGKHLLAIINDLLDLQKASASKLNIDMMDVDLNKVALASLSFLKPRAAENNIRLEIQKPTEHTIIKADPKRLKQAFLNLLSNAVKFTEEHGSVTVEIIPDYMLKKATIKIIDTGIGIKEEDIPKVLAGFYQIDGRLSKKYEGTGIGLPLTKKLVELMGGKMTIESKIKAGTTVTLEFAINTNFGADI